MKRLATLLICLWCAVLPVSALDIPAPTRNFFVNDYADVISPPDRNTLQQRAENLYHACDAQVVVVTLESLEGEAISDVSLRLARQWEIGDKDKDNGILLIFSESEPRVRIEVGSGLEGALPDSKVGRLLDTYMLPAYPDYSAGLVATQSAIINEIYIEYGISPDGDYTPIDDYDDNQDEGGLFSRLFKIAGAIFLIYLFISHPRLLLYLLYFGGGRGGRGGRGGGGFSGGGGGFSGGGADR